MHWTVFKRNVYLLPLWSIEASRSNSGFCPFTKVQCAYGMDESTNPRPKLALLLQTRTWEIISQRELRLRKEGASLVQQKLQIIRMASFFYGFYAFVGVFHSEPPSLSPTHRCPFPWTSEYRMATNVPIALNNNIRQQVGRQ
jgi:hypothetical protein